MATGLLDNGRTVFHSDRMLTKRSLKKVGAILWDFGDTLCDESWMFAPLHGVPGWPAVYQKALAKDDLVTRWELGFVSTRDVSSRVAAGSDLNVEIIERHMRECCRNIRFHTETMRLAASRAAPQAIVTVNPDIFSAAVVPVHRLHQVFSLIVTSWQENTIDKTQLCEIARKRLDPSLPRQACLLIDNRSENIDAWRAMGGMGHHYRGSEELLGAWKTFAFQT